MIIVILVATVIPAAGLAEVARRGYLGRRTVRDMQWHKPPTTIATLLTAQEMQDALRHASGAEGLTTRQVGSHANLYSTAANSVAANNLVTEGDLSSTRRALGAPYR